MVYTDQHMFLIFAFNIIIAIATSYFAGRKGRSQLGWFILAVFFGIIPMIVLYFIPELSNGNPTMAVSKPAPSLHPTPTKPFESSPEENRLWYYLDQNHQQIGPVSTIALRDLWDRALLDSNSYLWSEGMSQWQKLEELPDLKKILTKE